MANFVTDGELEAAASRLANSMLVMLDRAGFGPDKIGLPDQEDVGAFTRTFEVNAQLYMSMHPTRLTEEYNETRIAANANGPTSDPHSIVQAAMIGLEANWSGKAADAYFEQLGRVQQRITTQHEYTLVAAQAVSMMYAVDVSFRTSCHDLMHQTAAVCDAIADDIAPQQTNWAKVVVDLVGKAIDVVKNPDDILGMAIDGVLDLVGERTRDEPVEGKEAGPVVDGYAWARDRLFESYENSLNQIREWIEARRKEFAELDGTLPQPLPAFADVDSPDFRYGKFFDKDHRPVDYAPEVERERRRYVHEKAKPDGVIAERLAGAR